MQESTKFLLDSGDPDEYREISQIAKDNGTQLWGSTTNPSLIAKKLSGKKLNVKQAFALQKDLVLEIVSIVPGAVSAEVYAAPETTAEEMIEQGKDIATWHERVVVKLPTNIEGFKARTALRKEKIMTNNTLVFSQQQIFAICLHEYIMQKLYGPTNEVYPPFISPFVGRLDDIGEDGMSLVEHGMRIKQGFDMILPSSKLAIWMLEASVRTNEHIQRGMETGTELITAPAKIYKQWFAKTASENAPTQSLIPQSIWTPTEELTKIDTIEGFMEAITTGKLDISHQLTEKGIVKFVEDWKTILL
jgi:transaldolase